MLRLTQMSGGTKPPVFTNEQLQEYLKQKGTFTDAFLKALFKEDLSGPVFVFLNESDITTLLGRDARRFKEQVDAIIKIIGDLRKNSVMLLSMTSEIVSKCDKIKL